MYAKRIVLRNFKSFSKATVELDKSFTSVVGPNGSGKSNVVDSLLFSFGEMRLKSLRVKSTKDLIFKNANVAEACVLLVEDDVTDFTVQEVEEKGKTRRIFPKGVHEIRRLIRKDGKTRYMLDGKTVKKYVVEDFLTNHSISLHHVIKQGEVQRIIEMNSKDRRQLIDFVANVSEYEEKKQEAFMELAKVDGRLKESQTVFAEREGYLRELENDKKNAEKYLQLEQQQRQLAATLLHVDLKIMEKEFESLVAANLDYRNKVESLQGAIKELEATIDRTYQEKDALNTTIVEKSQGRESELQRSIGALQAEIDSAKSLIEDRKSVLKKMDEKRKTIFMDHQRAGDEIKGFERQLGQLTADVESVRKLLDSEQGQLEAMLKKSDAMSSQFFDARKRMQQYEEQMQGCKDQLNNLQLEASKQQELEKVKEHELVRLRKGIFDDYAPKVAELSDARRTAKAALAPQERLLAELFSEEKELNQRLPSLESALLDLKEKIATTEGRLRAASDSSSRGLEAVMALREKNKGIFGTLGELVRYSSKYSVPMGVALGNRLQYVVVDSVKTAGAVIEHLKANDLGRVSFIPLDKIQSPPSDDEYAKKPGSLGMLIDLLEFDAQFKKAVAYACSNTVLFDKFAAAEKWAGKARLVTSGGELFEPSGLVTGGKSKEKINAFAEQAKLSDYSKEFERSKSEKDAMVQRLYAIREEMSQQRKSKADADLQLKKVELELEHVLSAEKAIREQQKDLHSAMSQLEKEIGQCRVAVEKAEELRAEWVRKLSDLNVSYLDAKQLVDVEKEKHFGNQVKEKEHKVSELKINLAGLENELRSIQTQKGLYARQFAGVEKDMAAIKEEEESAQKVIRDMDERVAAARQQLKDKTDELKSLSKELKAWIEKREELDAQIAKAGNQKGKLQFELDKISSNRQDSELKRVAVETKLTELKVQYEEFREVQIIQNKTTEDKADLLLRKKDTEDKIKELGTVNLRAPELYQQKSEELERQKVRVVQLETEKNAVLSLIAEIETKKKATFMEAFDAVNAAFKKLFKVIFKGDGTLFLENMEDPFAGGLTIQVQLENKEVKYLELMSGGEKSLIALLFLFAIQSRNPSSLYILDEADAALDQENSRKLAMLLKQLASHSQFIVVSHNETLYKHADCLIGVAMGPTGSRLVEVKLNPA